MIIKAVGHLRESSHKYNPVVVPVMNAKEIMLDYEDYFTILLTGISGIFVNNLPLSS